MVDACIFFIIWCGITLVGVVGLLRVLTKKEATGDLWAYILCLVISVCWAAAAPFIWGWPTQFNAIP